jgi:hypothetical protein
VVREKSASHIRTSQCSCEDTSDAMPFPSPENAACSCPSWRTGRRAPCPHGSPARASRTTEEGALLRRVASLECVLRSVQAMLGTLQSEGARWRRVLLRRSPDHRRGGRARDLPREKNMRGARRAKRRKGSTRTISRGAGNTLPISCRLQSRGARRDRRR